MTSILKSINQKPLFQIVALVLTAFFLFSYTKKVLLKNKVESENHLISYNHNIPFTIAKNYFVKNTAPKLTTPRIDSETIFNTYFGMATTMGDNGLPTKIDFNSQSVIGLILPETNQNTTISPIALKKVKSGNILLSYKVLQNQKQSFSITPFLVLIIPKIEKGKVYLKEIK